MEPVICIPVGGGALDHAARYLNRRGITAGALPGADVTHLLLPVPSFAPDGRIRGGGSIDVLLGQLPAKTCVIGGNLAHPALAGYPTMDLLQDPLFVAENAAITAHCALKYILNALPATPARQRVLIIGWGRIGKCLARLLRGLDAHVTVCTRKVADRAMAQALGFSAVDPEADLSRFRILINTAPAQIFHEAQLARCRPDRILLDLASVPGLQSPDVIWARGLPGKDAAESSGVLIADTILRLLYQKEVSS